MDPTGNVVTPHATRKPRMIGRCRRGHKGSASGALLHSLTLTILPLLLIPAIALPSFSQAAAQQKQPVQVLPGDKLTLKAQLNWTTVPDLHGRTPEEASKLLADAGLALGEQTGGVGTGKLGTIMSQQPQAQTRAIRGSRVNIVLVRTHPSKDDVGPALTTVPNLVGTRIEAAGATLEEKNLQLGRIRRVDSEKELPGTVLSQRPAEGAHVAFGSPVHLTVVNRLMVIVPNLRGLTLAEAEKRLRSERLGMGAAATAESSEQEPGRLLAQEPGSGERVPAGTSVNVTLASAPPLAIVPDLKGSTLPEAAKMLEQAALRLGGTSEQLVEGVAAGTILNQKPLAGQKVRNGSAVDVLVARGLPQVEIPDVVGHTRADAEQVLEVVGLHVGTFTERETQAESGTVVEQTPKAGMKLSAGSAVDLVVSSGQPVMVSLRAEPPKPVTDGPVKLFARLDPPLPHASYQFFYGDGLASDWRTEPVTEHRYEAPAQYQANVVVQAGGREYRSAPLLLEVTGVYAVTLRADALRSGKNKTVLFTAVLEPLSPLAEYKFVFGDGNESEWSGRAESRHAYGGEGSHQAYVLARVAGGPQVRSNLVTLEVEGGISLGLVGGIAVLLGIAIGAGATLALRKPPFDPGTVRLLANVDPGRQRIEGVSDRDPGLAVEVRGVAVPGIQTVEVQEASD